MWWWWGVWDKKSSETCQKMLFFSLEMKIVTQKWSSALIPNRFTIITYENNHHTVILLTFSCSSTSQAHNKRRFIGNVNNRGVCSLLLSQCGVQVFEEENAAIWGWRSLCGKQRASAHNERRHDGNKKKKKGRKHTRDSDCDAGKTLKRRWDEPEGRTQELYAIPPRPAGFPVIRWPRYNHTQTPLPALHTDSPAAPTHTKTTANPCVKVTKKGAHGSGTCFLKRLITAAWTHLEYKRPLVHDQGARTSSASPARRSPSSPERPSACLIGGPSVRPSGEVSERSDAKVTKAGNSTSWKKKKMEGVLSSFLPPSSHLSSCLASRASLKSPLLFSPSSLFSLSRSLPALRRQWRQVSQVSPLRCACEPGQVKSKRRSGITGVCVRECVCECWGERKKHTHTVSWSHTLSRQRWVTQAAQVLIWKAGNRRQRACASEITVTTGPGKASVYLLNRFTPPSSLSASTSPFRFKVWRVAQMTREEIGKFWGRENVWGGSKGQLHNT